MEVDVATLAKRVTRAEALAAGHLIDTSACAAFLGFRFPAAVSAGVWDEVIGTPGVACTAAERTAASDRLRQVWVDAQQAVASLRAHGVQLPAIAFQSRTITGRKVALVLSCTVEEHRPVLTIHLQGGET